MVGVLAVGALVGMVLLWPGQQPAVEQNPAQRTEIADATLLTVEEVAGGTDVNNPVLGPGAVSVDISARIEDTGETVEFQMTDETGSLYEPGQKVRLAAISQEGLDTTYYISDFRRSGPLLLLTALFVAAVVWFGRLQGLRALFGLALTFGVIVGFMIPALLDGANPLAVAVIGSLLVMITTLYLSHGFSAKTTAAVVGTSLALVVTGALAVLFVGAANITGLASEEARLANVQVGGISLRGLLLAGIVIGGLGVLDDVTMSQSSIVYQLRRANPAATFADLVRGALAVGRDHIAATVNTLFLAYAGASLPLLILFAGSPDGLGRVMTSETVAVEIVRTLVGSIGLIAAVPLTTALAAALVLDGSSSADDLSIPGAGTAPEPDPELQIKSVDNSSTSVIHSENEEWERRLREAYRLDPQRDPQRDPKGHPPEGSPG